MVRITLALMVLFMLAACSELRTLRDDILPAGNGAQPGGRMMVHSWLDDMQALRKLTPEMQQGLLESREERFTARQDNRRRMDVVLLLMVADESVRDDRRARKLLRDYEPLPPATEDREFIRLLKQFLDTREHDAQKLAVLWEQVTEQSERISELEQQLRALTSIEQNIQQRENPAGETK